MSGVRLEAAPNGIGWLVLDTPDQKVNILTGAVLDEIGRVLDEVKNRSDVAALAVISGKSGTFIAGADVTEINAIKTGEEGVTKAAEGQAILHRFAELGKPTLAAIDGVCLGGGLELALACTFRIAADEARTKLGLPEVRLGIIPGFGGTQRLPRLVGVPAALDLILTGRSLSGTAALRMGLVDAVVPVAYLRTEAEKWLRHAVEHRAGHGRFARLERRRRRPAAARFLNSPLGRPITMLSARRRLDKTLNGIYPAPYVALKAVKMAGTRKIIPGLAAEASLVGPLIVSPTSKNLTWLFAANNDARRDNAVLDPSTGKPAAARTVTRAAVLGAGVMGGGIAHLLASDGIAVRMKDVTADALLKGLQAASGLVHGQVNRRRMTRREAAQRMARIAPTLVYDGLAGADVVIEAVVENAAVKQEVLKDVEERVGDRCVFATNTSSLPIRLIAEHAVHPERVVGLHFFNPVHRMPLVEVIAGAQSSPEAVATVHTLARRLGKTPIIVRDEPGFLVNRVLTAYLAEALKMLAEGSDPVLIDRAMEHFGMPMGPYALFDQIGFDTASKASKAIEAINEKHLPKISVMSRLVEAGRLGAKNGRGFYHYRKGRRTRFDRTVLDLIDRHGHAEKSVETIQGRLYLPMVNEAVRCLNAGVARSPADIDLGMVMGTGFPPFRGGPLRNADIAGISAIVERMNALAEKHGERLAPEPSLVEMALSGRRFYPE